MTVLQWLWADNRSTCWRYNGCSVHLYKALLWGLRTTQMPKTNFDCVNPWKAVHSKAGSTVAALLESKKTILVVFFAPQKAKHDGKGQQFNDNWMPPCQSLWISKELYVSWMVVAPDRSGACHDIHILQPIRVLTFGGGRIISWRLGTFFLLSEKKFRQSTRYRRGFDLLI